MICYVPLCFHCDFGSFNFIICIYLVIGISSMRLNHRDINLFISRWLNEGSKQISSQIVAKSL